MTLEDGIKMYLRDRSDGVFVDKILTAFAHEGEYTVKSKIVDMLRAGTLNMGMEDRRIRLETKDL